MSLSDDHKGVEKKPRLQEQCSLDSLPDECLYEILRRLPGNEERSNSARVSKRRLFLLSGIRISDLILKKESHDPNIVNAESYDEDEGEKFEKIGCHTLSLQGNDVTDFRVCAMVVRSSMHGGPEKLVIIGSHPSRGLTKVGLISIFRCCPWLKSISLLNVPVVTVTTLFELATSCPLLERLKLRGCNIFSSILSIFLTCPIVEKYSNLVSLTLDRCISIGNEHLYVFGRLCPKLKSVSIRKCYLIRDEGIIRFMSCTSESLTKLKLESLEIGDSTLASVGHYGKAVTELHLKGLRKVAEKGFFRMGNAMGLSNLETIVIISCCGMTNLVMDALIKGCPNLDHLLFRDCCNITGIGFTKIINKYNAPLYLNFEDCHLISFQSRFSSLILSPIYKLHSLVAMKCLGTKNNLLHLCNSFHVLTIRDCTTLTSASLALVSPICPNLTHLELNGLVGLTDDDLMPLILNNNVGLIKVSLKDCTNLKDLAICTLLEQHGNSLQALNLSGCNKITDQILLEISQNCTKLEELDLSWTDVSDYGVGLLASTRQLEIRILSFSGCSKVTSLSLPLLGNMGPALEFLNLKHCNIDEASGRSDLKKKLYLCDISY